MNKLLAMPLMVLLFTFKQSSFKMLCIILDFQTFIISMPSFIMFLKMFTLCPMHPPPPLAKQKPIYFINWECAVQEYLADTSMIIKKRRERLRVRLNPIIDKVVQHSHISMID